jgi:hypothetical protein
MTPEGTLPPLKFFSSNLAVWSSISACMVQCLAVVSVNYMWLSGGYNVASDMTSICYCAYCNCTSCCICHSCWICDRRQIYYFHVHLLLTPSLIRADVNFVLNDWLLNVDSLIFSFCWLTSRFLYCLYRLLIYVDRNWIMWTQCSYFVAEFPVTRHKRVFWLHFTKISVKLYNVLMSLQVRCQYSAPT